MTRRHRLLGLYVRIGRTYRAWALHLLGLLDFVVYGTKTGAGSVSVQTDLAVKVEENDG